MNLRITHVGVISFSMLLFLLSNVAAATAGLSAILFQGAGLAVFFSLLFLGWRLKHADLYLILLGLLILLGSVAIVAYFGNPFFFRTTRDTLVLVFSLIFFTKFGSNISMTDRIASILLAVFVGVFVLEQFAPGVLNMLAESLRSETRIGGFDNELGGERNLFNSNLFGHIQYRRPFGPMLSPVASAYVAAFVAIYFHLRRKNIQFLISVILAIAFTAKGPFILLALYFAGRIRPSLAILGSGAAVAFAVLDPLHFGTFDLHFASNRYLLSNLGNVGAFYNTNVPVVSVVWITTENLDTFFSKIMYYSPYLGVAFYLLLWGVIKRQFYDGKSAAALYAILVALSFFQVEALSYYNFLLITFVAIADNLRVPRALAAVGHAPLPSRQSC
jgi:hypothetical protein